MSKEERDEPMNTAIKKIAKDGITGLTKEKKRTSEEIYWQQSFKDRYE